MPAVAAEAPGFRQSQVGLPYDDKVVVAFETQFADTGIMGLQTQHTQATHCEKSSRCRGPGIEMDYQTLIACPQKRSSTEKQCTLGST